MKFKSNIEVQAGVEDSSGSAGTAGQILSSLGPVAGVDGTAWIDPSTIVAEAASLVIIACKNTSGAAIPKGTPVYQTGNVGATATIEIAPADALISANKLPAIGVLQTDLNNNGFGNVVITGELTNFTTSPIDGVVPTTGDKIFVKSGGGLTLTKPTGEGNGIQNMGLVGKVSSGNSGSITVSSIMRTNDVPNLPEGRIWIGDGNTIVSDTVYVDEPNNRVGIGTTSPQGKLHVLNGTAGTYAPDSESDTLVVESATPGGISLIGTGTGSASKQSITFGTTSDTTSARIIYDSNSSFLSIGTTTASNYLKLLSGNGATALTLDASQNATFEGSVKTTQIEIESSVPSILFDETDVTANWRNRVQSGGYRVQYASDGTTFTDYLVLGANSTTVAKDTTFTEQAFSSATSSGDASSTLTTKGYVDGLITGATIYRGAWDPSGGGYGSPDLSGVTQTSGYYYICSADGTAEPNGTGTEPDTWAVGDWVIYNDVSGTGQWQKIDNSSVLSGVGTGQTVALWEGAGSVTDSETLGNAPITVSGNNTTFTGDIAVSGGDIVSNGNTVVSNSANANTLRVGDALLASTTQTIKFRTNGADALQLNSAQNATFAGMITVNGGGIDIDNDDDIRLRFDNASAFKAGLQVATTAGDMIAGSAIDDFAIRAQENMLFSSGGNVEVLRLDTSGNVGIGTTTPQSKLQVAGSIQMADDTDAASADKVGTMRYRTDTEYVEVDGTELITNGDFATDTAWVKGTGWTISGGTASKSAGSQSDLDQYTVTTLGDSYKVGLTVSGVTAGSISVRLGTSASNAIGSIDANGTYTFYGTVTADLRLRIRANATFVGSIDDVSVIQVTEEDASYADMCMQTGASTYEWVNIVRNTY